MSKIKINYTSCIHSRSVLAECTKCQNACEYDSIKIQAQQIEFYNDKCIGCFACLSACPTSAISAIDVDILGFVSDFLDSKSSLISMASSNISPLAFDEQTILTMLLLKKRDIVIECQSEISPKMAEKAENVNSYSKAFGSEFECKLSNESNERVAVEKDRRSFLRAFNSKNIIKAAREINEQASEVADRLVYEPSMLDYAQLRQKSLPSSREGLLSVIKHIEIPLGTNVKSVFSTDKIIDDSCTNCELCYNLCPTGALTTTRFKNAINFESSKCIKCALCEDVCASKSIHSLPEIDLVGFATQSKKELIKFQVARCGSCGTVFVPNDKEYVCARCAREDEDAIDLSGFTV